MGWPTRETAHSGPSPACYLAERLLTEARGTASGFCYHSGAAVAGFVTPMASYFAVERHMGFAVPMLIHMSAISRCWSGQRPKGMYSVPN
jgi:hypothetical protein